MQLQQGTYVDTYTMSSRYQGNAEAFTQFNVDDGPITARLLSADVNAATCWPIIF